MVRSARAFRRRLGRGGQTRRSHNLEQGGVLVVVVGVDVLAKSTGEPARKEKPSSAVENVLPYTRVRSTYNVGSWGMIVT